jgi:hypothetical protein
MRLKWKIGGIAVAAGLLAGGAMGVHAAAAADDNPLPSIVEDFSYPGAAAVKQQRGIELISGDGRITLLDNCDGAEPKIQVETFATGAEPRYCFAVKGNTGRLTLNVPNVYLIFAGDEQLYAKYTVDGNPEDVTIKANGLAGIGAESEDAGVLLELRAG